MIRANGNKMRDVTFIMFTGTVLRLAWAWRRVLAVGDTFNRPISIETVGDAADYIRLARNIIFHHVFSLAQPGEVLSPTAFRPPLYPALIASLWWNEKVPVAALFFAQAVLGAATAALTYLIACRYFSRRVAIIAGVGMMIAPMSILYVGAVMTETLFTFLLILGIFAGYSPVIAPLHHEGRRCGWRQFF